MPRLTQAEYAAWLRRRIENHHKTPGPEPEQIVCNGPLGPEANQGANATRFIVRVVSYRSRLLDQDNLCPKYFIDGLRYAALLPDDRPEQVSIQTTQVKVSSTLEERTEITITPLLK